LQLLNFSNFCLEQTTGIDLSKIFGENVVSLVNAWPFPDFYGGGASLCLRNRV